MVRIKIGPSRVIAGQPYTVTVTGIQDRKGKADRVRLEWFAWKQKPADSGNWQWVSIGKDLIGVGENVEGLNLATGTLVRQYTRENTRVRKYKIVAELRSGGTAQAEYEVVEAPSMTTQTEKPSLNTPLQDLTAPLIPAKPISPISPGEIVANPVQPATTKEQPAPTTAEEITSIPQGAVWIVIALAIAGLAYGAYSVLKTHVKSKGSK